MSSILKQSILKHLAIALLVASPSLMAKSNYEIDKDSAYSGKFGFINNLNSSLRAKLDVTDFQGVKNVSAFQKNRHIVLQVIHNPLVGYRELIDDIAESGSRANGVNFQNSFTLHILSNYCKAGTFYEIQAAGLSKDVLVQYEDTKGQRIAVHTISRNMCS